MSLYYMVAPILHYRLSLRVKVEQEVICAIKEELDSITFNTKEQEYKRECFLITAVGVSYRSEEEIRMYVPSSFYVFSCITVNIYCNVYLNSMNPRYSNCNYNHWLCPTKFLGTVIGQARYDINTNIHISTMTILCPFLLFLHPQFDLLLDEGYLQVQSMI
ncbi:hypothetical protein CPB85DRAFT_1257414 [Mucidula mucida]|nr:hypothetical protein CPB85DRAFT_1257414 [Mucidula mucida]